MRRKAAQKQQILEPPAENPADARRSRSEGMLSLISAATRQIPAPAVCAAAVLDRACWSSATAAPVNGMKEISPSDPAVQWTRCPPLDLSLSPMLQSDVSASAGRGSGRLGPARGISQTSAIESQVGHAAEQDFISLAPVGEQLSLAMPMDSEPASEDEALPGQMLEKRLRQIFEQCVGAPPEAGGPLTLNKRKLIKLCREDHTIAAFFRLPQQIRQEDGSRDAFEKEFQGIDTNNDREIDWEEFKAFYMKRRSVFCRLQPFGVVDTPVVEAVATMSRSSTASQPGPTVQVPPRLSEAPSRSCHVSWAAACSPENVCTPTFQDAAMLSRCSSGVTLADICVPVAQPVLSSAPATATRSSVQAPVPVADTQPNADARQVGAPELASTHRLPPWMVAPQPAYIAPVMPSNPFTAFVPSEAGWPQPKVLQQSASSSSLGSKSTTYNMRYPPLVSAAQVMRRSVMACPSLQPIDSTVDTLTSKGLCRSDSATSMCEAKYRVQSLSPNPSTDSLLRPGDSCLHPIVVNASFQTASSAGSVTVPVSGPLPLPPMPLQAVHLAEMKRGSITDVLFDAVDVDHDGLISRSEFRAALKSQVLQQSTGFIQALQPDQVRTPSRERARARTEAPQLSRTDSWRMSARAASPHMRIKGKSFQLV